MEALELGGRGSLDLGQRGIDVERLGGTGPVVGSDIRDRLLAQDWIRGKGRHRPACDPVAGAWPGHRIRGGGRLFAGDAFALRAFDVGLRCDVADVDVGKMRIPEQRDEVLVAAAG